MWWFFIPLFRFRTHRACNRCRCAEPTAPAEKVKRPSWALLWGLLFFPAMLLDANYPGLWPLWVLSVVASGWCGVMAYRPRPTPAMPAAPPEPPRPQAYYSNRR